MSSETKFDFDVCIVGTGRVGLPLALSLVDVGLKKNPLIDAVNVEGTRNVVEVAQELGVPFLVYTSSEDVVLTKDGVTEYDLASRND